MFGMSKLSIKAINKPVNMSTVWPPVLPHQMRFIFDNRSISFVKKTTGICTSLCLARCLSSRHDMAEILLKLALNTNQTINT
jgi:hypothetical protein